MGLGLRAVGCWDGVDWARSGWRTPGGPGAVGMVGDADICVWEMRPGGQSWACLVAMEWGAGRGAGRKLLGPHGWGSSAHV